MLWLPSTPQVAASAKQEKKDIPFSHKKVEALELLGKSVVNIASQQDAILAAIQQQLNSAASQLTKEAKEALKLPMLSKALGSLTYAAHHQVDLGLKVAGNMVKARRQYYLTNSNTPDHVKPQLMTQPLLAPQLFNGQVGVAERRSVDQH